MIIYQIAKDCQRLPFHNNLEIFEIPYDLLSVLSYRKYIDSIKECLSQYEHIPTQPNKRTLEYPPYFKCWLKYAKEYKPKENQSQSVIESFSIDKEDLPPEESWLMDDFIYMWWGLTLDEIINLKWEEIEEAMIWGREEVTDDVL